MEISGNNIGNLSNIAALWEKGHRQTPLGQDEAIKQEDSVRISNFPQSATLLSDEEADVVLQETTDSIQNDPYNAMLAHSGLDASRVAALLA